MITTFPTRFCRQSSDDFNQLCPGCADQMVLQDRKAGAWFCANCRRWTDGQGRPLPRIEKPQPVTRDADDARRLIEDLRAAGCSFVIEGGELRLRFPSRISSGLWARFESAGDVFRSMAMESAIRAAWSRAVPEIGCGKFSITDFALSLLRWIHWRVKGRMNGFTDERDVREITP